MRGRGTETPRPLSPWHSRSKMRMVKEAGKPPESGHHDPQTHAIVGGAIASFMPGQPVLAFVIGVASHFAIDAIPHVDYPLHSISVKRSAPSALTLNWWLVQDLGLIALDACVGLAIVLWLYASPGAATAVLAGALGAMLPDPLQLLHKLYPREPLRVCPGSCCFLTELSEHEAD
jgi:hypothetical protein